MGKEGDMPKATNTPKSEVQKVRITRELRQRCSEARQKSIFWSERSESEFLGYLISLGIVRYERNALADEIKDQEKGVIVPGEQEPSAIAK
jgi:CRISPR/Cas system type I-B associated protein Csh2 (Cas7 group RAMP superfamily)